MFDFFFDYTQFVCRDHCGNWNEAMVLVYKLANLAVAGAYLVLASTFCFSVTWMNLLFDHRLRRIFISFVLCCAVGHLEGYVAFYWPAYHFFAVWQVITATVSWGCVYALVTYKQKAKGTIQ